MWLCAVYFNILIDWWSVFDTTWYMIITLTVDVCERFDSIRSGLVRIRFDSIRFGSIRSGSVRIGSVRFGSDRIGSVRFGSVRFGSIFFCLT